MRLHPLSHLALACAAALALAAPAAATPGSTGSGKCLSPKLEQPFSAWGDDASYSLLPDGGLERRGADWSLDGGAAVVDGNEPWAVRHRNDRRSLALPAGSAATSGSFCVTGRHSHLRFFVARQDGAALDTLGVTAVVTDEDGSVAEHELAGVTGAEWAPSEQVDLSGRLPELADGGAVEVRLRFAPAGGAGWLVDDVYVDPPVRCC